MDKHEEMVIRHAERILPIILLMIKAYLKHGNKKVVTSGYQRYEEIGHEYYYDKENDVIYFPGS